MVALGTQAPDFALPDVTTGELVRRSDFDAKKGPPGDVHLPALPVCPARPEGTRRAWPGLPGPGRGDRGDQRQRPRRLPGGRSREPGRGGPGGGYPFPYLFDETQEVAKGYSVACTPDFFLFDADRKLAYRGQFDSSRPGTGVPVTGQDLRAAIDAVLADRPVPQDQRPSVGCTIKWRPRNELGR